MLQIVLRLPLPSDRGVTGFNEEDIVVTHATIDNFKTVKDSSYTATIAPDISTCGNIAMNLPAGSALDVDSDIPNFAAQQVTVEVVDDIPPNARARNITVAARCQRAGNPQRRPDQ